MTELTCIVCPVGCRLKVEQGKEGLKIIGNGCRRGVAYARDEMTAPKRMLPVKTETAIPKAKIYAAMEEIKAITVSPPVMIGQVIKENLAESGVPLVATGTIAGEGCFKPLEKSLGSE